MNLNKADRKVYLPPREKTSRTRTPRKKQDDFNDEVRWRGTLQRASLSPRLRWWLSGWQAEVGAWAGSRGRGLGWESGPGLGLPPCAAPCNGALQHAPCVAAARLQDLEEEGTVLERKQRAAEKKLREGAHPQLPGVLGRRNTCAAGVARRVRARLVMQALPRCELRELCRIAVPQARWVMPTPGAHTKPYCQAP